MSTVVSNKIVVPPSVRRKAGIKPGDRVKFTIPSSGTITIVANREEDEYTPAERRAIDRGIDQSLKEYRRGKVAGPFETAEEFLRDLHRENARLGARKKTKRTRK